MANASDWGRQVKNKLLTLNQTVIFDLEVYKRLQKGKDSAQSLNTLYSNLPPSLSPFTHA